MASALLTGKQLRHLRALGHALSPTVQVGKQGYTAAVAAQIDEALGAHELIKVKLARECPTEPEELTEAVRSQLGAEVAQQIGHILLIYRRHPKEPKIVLPARARGE